MWRCARRARARREEKENGKLMAVVFGIVLSLGWGQG